MPQKLAIGMVSFLVMASSAWSFPDQPKKEAPADVPRVHDSRLEVVRFASAPDIVHPIGIDFDSRGRLLVIESHTHFRPANYQGPARDRIRILEDTDGDGKADRFTTFHEGEKATMDIAVHPDGSVYLATRNEILRLRDTDGDGKADERRRIVFLDTKGDYPHNGLSGLSFDSRGNLLFGMGENLGSHYKVIGADGTTIQGEGDGGHIFWCTADGKGLRPVATGFWNPFGTCRDLFGRIFAVDNDPDASPPCRLVHVVEGGDYGFQFRYGRSGRHIFQSWNGQLTGTLPMASGTGESPCEILSYESDGLPPEYLGNLLVAAWADHRVERYELKERGASYAAERKPFLQGGKDFRPVGLMVAPDGSLFVSDWVRRDYNLHGQGAIWQVRQREAMKPQRPTDPREGLLSLHRPMREAAARKLAEDAKGRKFLLANLKNSDPRVRVVCLTALLDATDRTGLELKPLADNDAYTPIRAMAVRALVARGDNAIRFLDANQTATLRLEAIGSLQKKEDGPRLLQFLGDPDPFLRNAAVQQLARAPKALDQAATQANATPLQRIGLLLTWRASGRPEAMGKLTDYLTDADEEVRFLAVKWIADEKFISFRPQVVDALKDRALNVRMHLALATALARLDGQEISDAKMADHFVGRLGDPKLAPAMRARILTLVPAAHPKLTIDLLGKLMREDSPELKREAIRALADRPDAGGYRLLHAIVQDKSLDSELRAEALAGMAEDSAGRRDELLDFAKEKQPVLRNEALRNLVGESLTADQRQGLEALAKREPDCASLVARVLGKPFIMDRPAPADLEAWLKRLEGLASAEAGRRIFFHSKLAGCYRCHRVEGRGRDIGPDLGTVSRNGLIRNLESILQPSKSVAPHFQVWRIETSDGKTHTGMLIGTHLDEYTYIDEKGKTFKLLTPDMVETKSVPTSLMPDNLVNQLTDQELRDLLAYLQSLK